MQSFYNCKVVQWKNSPFLGQAGGSNPSFAANKMDCLKNYIGINGCNTQTPESGLYINSLPGISLKSIEALADEDQKNYLGVFNDIDLRASKKIDIEVASVFAKKYKKKSINQTIDLTTYIDRDVNVDASAKYKGFCITAASELGYVKSQYQQIYISTLRIYLKAAGTYILKVFNLDTSEELYTYTGTGSIGWNTVKVSTSFTARRLFCCYNATEINSYSLPIKDSVNEWNTTCCSYYYGLSCGASLTGIIADLDDVSSYTEIYGEAYGISGVWSLQCSFDNIICNNKPIFATAYLYLLGSELMVERLSSDRINRFTTIDLEKAQQNLEYFIQCYTKELEIAIDGIELDINDACIECNANYKTVESRM